MNRSALVERAYFAERVAHRLHRAISDTASSRMKSELAFRARRDDFATQIPGSSGDDHLLEALRRDGIVLTDVHQLGLESILEAAAPLAQELLDQAVDPSLPATHLAPDRVASAPEIFRWGASDRVLDLLERYFEVPVGYHGVYLRRDMAVDQVGASNNWHLDMEDRRVIKIVVYLTDVSDGDGSFQYVPLEQSLELNRTVGPRYKLGPDDSMRRLVPADYWQTAKGPIGTVLISDTGRLWHKGRRPRHRDRATLFYDYTSQDPQRGYYCKSALPRPYLEELSAGLGQRAQDAIFWKPKLAEFDPAKHE